MAKRKRKIKRRKPLKRKKEYGFTPKMLNIARSGGGTSGGGGGSG